MTCKRFHNCDYANDGETCKTGSRYCGAYRQYNTHPMIGLSSLILWILCFIVGYIGGKL